MTLAVTYRSEITTVETIVGGPGEVLQISHAGMNIRVDASAITVPPVTDFSTFAKALVAGAGTIDLAALPGTNGTTVNGTGKKVQFIKVANPSTNTHPQSLVAGASNGYNLFGASWKITLNPGEEFTWQGFDAAGVPDIASGARTIDLSDGGAASTQALNFTIICG